MPEGRICRFLQTMLVGRCWQYMEHELAAASSSGLDGQLSNQARRRRSTLKFQTLLEALTCLEK